MNFELISSPDRLTQADWETLERNASVFHHKAFFSYFQDSGESVSFFLCRDQDQLVGFIPLLWQKKSIFHYAILPIEAWLADSGKIQAQDFYGHLFNALSQKIMWVDGTSNMARFKQMESLGVRRARYGTYVVDLRQEEEVLWKKIHPKHRNKIRGAEKKGVQIERFDQFDETFEIMDQTLRRAGSAFLTKADFQSYWRHVVEPGKALVYRAVCQGQTQGVVTVPFSSTRAYYQHGGSVSDCVTGAMNLLHWHVMKEMKKQGVQAYDFGGARYKADPNSKAYSIQHFKERFGGEFEDVWIWDKSFHLFFYSFAKFLKKTSLLLRGRFGPASTLDQEVARQAAFEK